MKNLLNFSLTASEIKNLSQTLISKSRAVYDQVSALSSDRATFKNAIIPIAKIEAEYSVASANIYFPQYVSPIKEVRDASVEANKALEEFSIETDMRADIYKVVLAVAEKNEELGPEDKRLLEKMLLDYKRNGLGLNEKKQELLKEIKKKLSNLAIQFSSNMNEDNTTVIFTEEELEGVPADYLKSLNKRVIDQKEYFVLTMKYPDVFAVLKNAVNEETRRRMDYSYSTKCKANLPILEEAVRLRRDAAQVLGYEDHATFRLETRMAKTPENVFKFLEDLKNKLTPLGEKELERLRQLKKEHLESLGKQFNGSIEAFDFHFYHKMLMEKDYQINEEEIKEYFSLESVTQGMLDIYQKVLNLKFTEIENKNVWHQDVRTFNVIDATSDEVIGQFYLDLFPRDGKYTHAACFGLQPGYIDVDTNERCYPVAAMVANFSKPMEGKPSLLKHNEVVTYFHELGHVMHQICSKTKHARFHGTKVERDFVEAPSQMLENWCWEPTILHKLSEHYQRKGEKLPSETIERMVKAKNLNAGLLNLRQLFFGFYDMKLHTAKESLGATKLWDELKENITLIPNPHNTWPVASFGHIMGGYDAGYYGYLWSQVFSADMFFSKFKNNVMSVENGLQYRKLILGPGGSRDGDNMLRDFLGRDPTVDPFLKSIGYNK
ncbi:zincin [Rozella allomycis CSF55]|uniref:Zincin n=1 Tax=Rozella allomycis (strain CSF55) TaxID=988480 RepID=A0A4P9YG88_ROZAC|nr:zincin [Rozella allomycis CSF55]